MVKKCIFGMDTLDAISADRILYICSFQTTLECFAKLRPVKFISTQERLNQHTFTKNLKQYLITFIEILINLILSCIIQAPHPICTKNIAYLTINSKSQRNISKLISFIPITFAIAHIMYIGHGWISLLDNEIQSKNIKLKWFLLVSYLICPCPMLSSYIFQIQF